MKEASRPMPTDKTDTDPSTPSARSNEGARGARGDGPIAPAKIVAVAPSVNTSTSPPPTPSTDPGPPPYMPNIHAADTDPQPMPPAAAPSAPPPSTQRSRGAAPTPVAVPVPNLGSHVKNDSIDMLLDGIAGDTRKVAESRGEASLAYAGSEHTPPAPRKTPVPEAPVIVKRREMPPTVRLERAMIEAAVAKQTKKPADNATVIVPRTQGPRVVVALFAAIAVVLAVFLGMNSWSSRLKRAAMAVDPSASELVTSPPPGAWTPAASAATSVPTSVPTATSTATSTGTSTSTQPSTQPSMSTPPSTPPPTAKNPRPRGTSTGTDLGEFKPSIHH
jgi:hypothetical protein